MRDYAKEAEKALAKCNAAAEDGILRAFNLGVATERARCAAVVREYRAKVTSTVTGRSEEFGLEPLADLLEAG